MVSVKNATIIGGSIGVLFLFGGPLLLDAISRVTFVPGEMPTCDARYTKDLLQQAISGGPLAKQTGMTVASVGRGEAFEIPGFVQSNDKRVCHAMVFTSAGKLEAVYSIEWSSADKDEIWLQVASLQNNPWSPLNRDS